MTEDDGLYSTIELTEEEHDLLMDYALEHIKTLNAMIDEGDGDEVVLIRSLKIANYVYLKLS